MKWTEIACFCCWRRKSLVVCCNCKTATLKSILFFFFILLMNILPLKVVLLFVFLAVEDSKGW